MSEAEPLHNNPEYPSGQEWLDHFGEAIRKVLPPTLLNHLYLMENGSVPNTGVIVGDIIDSRGKHLQIPLAIITPDQRFISFLSDPIG